MEGHKTLSTLCSNEFDELKSEGIGNSQSVTDTSRYALEHGVQHMLQLDQDMKSCSLEQGVGKYVSDLELLYAKLCVNQPGATEDIVGVMKQGALKTISAECCETLSSLLFLLKKHRITLKEYPYTLFQCLLNEGSSKLSSDSRKLLETKYSDKPHMELLNKNHTQRGIQARFSCESQVACLDVSPSLEYMVCECRDGSIQFWSLASGNLKWKRYVKPKQYGCDGPFRIIVTSHELVVGFYRSVVFHPIKDLILPGVLDTVYSFNGDSKPLFPTSKCSFSVCSICGDEMLTDCPDDAKCLTMWNLNDGREIDRVYREKDILSFAVSQDGKLVAISHSPGSICLVDRENGFSTLSEVPSWRFGMIRLSPDSRFLFCSKWLNDRGMFPLGITEGLTYSIHLLAASRNSFKLESCRIGGFLLGDPLFEGWLSYYDVVLDSESLLRNHTRKDYIELVYRHAPTKNTEFEDVTCLQFSLTGESVYARVYVGSPGPRIIALDVYNRRFKGQKQFEINFFDLVPLKEGVLFATKNTLELWNSDLSVCMRSWRFGADAVFPISDDQVACITYETRDGIIFDTVSGDTVKTFKLPHGELIACNGDLQLFAWPKSQPEFIEMRELGTTELLWRALQGARYSSLTGLFSPKGKFVAVSSLQDGLVYVLDAGKVLLEYKDFDIRCCKFIGDEECIFLKSIDPIGGRLELFNVRSGDLLTVMDVEGSVLCNSPLATCPRMGLIAMSSRHIDLKIIKVKQPEEKTLSRETKRLLQE
ncbi:uncharacterized protein [Montipora capricornis]|uniref:uncharacterized protein n=1 Tax=Montipora capricornis TaxID=246305 RepID=UPI0035F15E79